MAVTSGHRRCTNRYTHVFSQQCNMRTVSLANSCRVCMYTYSRPAYHQVLVCMTMVVT